MQGHKPEEVRRFADDAIRFNLESGLGAKQKLGTQERAASIRIYEQIADLIRALQKNGFDVWITSASAQNVVEPFASRVGIEPSHVIGVRSTLDRKGRLTSAFESCGPYPAGNQDIISYRQGKRCWINRAIARIKDPRQMMELKSPIAFAAGDSDTDTFFVQDASTLRLVINRNKRELMCRAYAGLNSPGHGAWLINPMFIEPKGKLTEGYRCKDFGLPDQEDSVSSL
jgi:hypothetical protein